jgi:hypothetical protein
MKPLEHVRIWRAAQSYDFWLDVNGVSGARRRELRSELRRNLVDAAADGGAPTAIGSLGSLRQMAREASPADPTKPRWRSGLSMAAAAAAVMLLVELLAALAWVDGAMAASPDRSVIGSMALFPGSTLEYAPGPDGFSVSFFPGWLWLAVAALVLLIAARPWRVLTRRGSLSGHLAR